MEGFIMEDWRLFDQEEYLLKKTLIHKDYRTSSAGDHEHCCFCWEKFSRMDEDLHLGYCTEDEYHWICEKCYQDFRLHFQWVVKN